MNKIPIGATIAHAYRFAFADFLKILSVVWLPLLILWVPSFVMRPQWTALAAHDFASIGRMWPLFVLLYVVGFILMFMQVVGIARIALGLRRGPSWFYFSLDRPVWRLIGSILLLFLAIIIGWIVVLLGGLLLGFLLGLIGKLANNVLVNGLIAILVGVGAVALWCGYIYSVVRLSFLLTPVVVAEPQGFALERSWSLGRGNFWRIFVVFLAVFLPFLVLEGIFVFGFMFHGVAFPAPHASPEQIAAYQAAINVHAMAMMESVYRYWYIAYPVGIVFVVLFYGLAVGAPCFAYRTLTEPDASVPVAGGRLPD